MDKKHSTLLPFHQFLLRFLRNIILGWISILIALYIGMWGYHHYEHFSWVDSFVNAAMILSGMGPLTPLLTVGGKIFAGCYALFSGLAFIFIIGLIFAPVVHRFLHKYHLEQGL
jgi:hypothetical protein